MKKQLSFMAASALLVASLLTGCSKDEDISAPVITLAGGSTLTYSLPSTAGSAGTWTDPGFTASDDEDGNVTSRVTSSGTVNLNRKGTYTITYSVSDDAGNSTSETRTVRVVNDAETFAGAYNNCVDSCVASGVSTFNATVATSDSVNELVSISNFGAFGASIKIYASITDTTASAPINIASNQSVGGNAYIQTVYQPNTFVISASPSVFTVKYQWNDGTNSDVCTSYYRR